MSTQAETTTVTMTVGMTVRCREGQSPESAAQEMRTTLREYLTEPDHPFRNDYGIIEGTDSQSADVGWGGYEGPFVTAVTVTD